LVYEKNLIYKTEQLAPLAKSDHNILNITLNVTFRNNETKVKCYSYNKANYNTLDKLLGEIDWREECNNRSVNEVWETLKKQLTDFKENSIPHFNRSSSNDVPWLNAKLRKLIKKRNNLFKRYKKTGQSYTVK